MENLESSDLHMYAQYAVQVHNVCALSSIRGLSPFAPLIGSEEGREISLIDENVGSDVWPTEFLVICTDVVQILLLNIAKQIWSNNGI